MTVVAGYAVPHPPLILPEVGQGREKEIQPTIEAYRQAAADLARQRPETVVLLSPHTTIYADYFHISPGSGATGEMSRFGARQPKTQVDYDQDFVAALSALATHHGLGAGTIGEKDKRLDHGSIVPLRFFQEAYPDFAVVRIGISGLSPLAHYQLGQYIFQVAEKLGRRVVVVASGDLSHKLKADGPYGYDPAGPTFDRQVMAALGGGDFLTLLQFSPDFCEAAAECGLRCFQVLAGAFDGRQVASQVLSYEGPFGVGYGICTFAAGGSDESRRFALLWQEAQQKTMAMVRAGEDLYVQIARQALESSVKTGKAPARAKDLPSEMRDRLLVEGEELTATQAGAFVSLKKEGKLRGCIGTIWPTQASLLEEILHNAVSAGREDPRFPPVEEEELSQLVYHVDVLEKPESIGSIAELDVRRYGVIVTAGNRRGLLLPDLAGVDTPEAQVDIALQKAGIKKGEAYRMERFMVVRHQ